MSSSCLFNCYSSSFLVSALPGLISQTSISLRQEFLSGQFLLDFTPHQHFSHCTATTWLLVPMRISSVESGTSHHLCPGQVNRVSRHYIYRYVDFVQLGRHLYSSPHAFKACAPGNDLRRFSWCPLMRLSFSCNLFFPLHHLPFNCNTVSVLLSRSFLELFSSSFFPGLGFCPPCPWTTIV